MATTVSAAQAAQEKILVLSALWTTFAGAFLLVVVANY
jgi:hypothetical protein